MKRKRLLAIGMALLMTAGLLAGCGSSSSTTNESASGDNEEVTIRILTRIAGTSKQTQVYNEILDEFKADYPEVTIVDNSQSDESAFNNLIASDIASGDMPNIFRIQGVANLADYIDNGLIMDVSSYLEEDADWGDGFTEGSLNYFKVQGYDGYYAIPMESGTISFNYNKALLEKAGISEFPKTWSEFLDAIEKLKASGVIPIAMGAQSTYMAGHLHDSIFYKWLGTDAAKELGSRTINWTDDEVVQTLQYVKDLIDAGAFDPNAAGLTDEMALTQFREGQAAMILTGPWNIDNFSDKSLTAVADDVEIANFPYFEEKPEYQNENMQTLGCYMISGQLEGKELELTVELVKRLTDKDAAKRFAEDAGVLIPRNDIEIDESKVSRLLVDNIKLGENNTGVGVDVFDFDPIASMQDRTRNSIVSMFINASAEEAAAEIQSEIDNAQ
ncbi:MAG: ABC transporter substrate-binding protein [Lachnospiraceae bacterium]